MKWYTDIILTNTCTVYHNTCTSIHNVNAHTYTGHTESHAQHCCTHITRDHTSEIVDHPNIMEATQVSLLTTTFIRGTGACLQSQHMLKEVKHMSSELSHSGSWLHHVLVDQSHTDNNAQCHGMATSLECALAPMNS